MKRQIIDLQGKRFGKLAVLERADKNKGNYAAWECLCDCGNLKTISGSHLRRGDARSCGKCKTATYFEKDGYMTCITRQGKEFIFDTEDYDLIKQYQWGVNELGYVSEGRSSIKLTHLVLNVPSNVIIDHINNTPTDNRKDNLRIASSKQNSWNAKLRIDNKTGYKGVHHRGKTYLASIRVSGKGIYLGNYHTTDDAACAYNRAAIEYFGEYAWLNPLPAGKNVSDTPLHHSRIRQNVLGYRGVEYNDNGNRRKPYNARIHAYGKRIFLGSYKSAEEAAIAYNEAVLQYFGDAAKLNNIPPTTANEKEIV